MWSITRPDKNDKHKDTHGVSFGDKPYFLQNETSSSKKERMPLHLRTAREFASETTLHGMGIIAQPRNTLLRKIMWILIILTMTGLCVSVVFESVQTYLKYESVTSMSTVANQTLDLPAITICNMNFMKASQFQKHYAHIEDLMLRSRSTTASNFSESEIETLKNISTVEFLTHTSFSASDIFVNCYFKTAETVNCEDYVTKFFTEQSVCHTFHSQLYIKANGTKKQIDNGQFNGFTLTMDAMWSEYILPTADAGYGLYALVHDQSVYPFMQMNSFLLSPGKIFYMALQRNEIIKLQKPYSPTDCIDTTLPENSNYSIEECWYNCLMYALYRGECSYDSTWEPHCNMYDTFAIALERYFRSFEKTTQEKKACSEGCLPKCHEVTYSYKLSSTLFHDTLIDQLAQIHNWRDSNKTYIKQNYIQLKVYYDTLDITYRKQVASMDLERLLGFTGGQLGLCLGASLITISELLEFLLTYSIRISLKLLAHINSGRQTTTKVQQLHH